MKCRDCSNARRGWFKSLPEAYVCIGVKHPFVINNYPDAECTEYKDKYEESTISKEEKILFPFQFIDKYLLGQISLDDAVDKTIEELNRLIEEYVNKHLKT